MQIYTSQIFQGQVQKFLQSVEKFFANSLKFFGSEFERKCKTQKSSKYNSTQFFILDTWNVIFDTLQKFFWVPDRKLKKNWKL